ncbi:hypothetical protein VUR80DRAFT_5050 [Thermomyces stellatus]
MRFSALATLVALAAPGLADNHYICETSGASPMLHHVNWLIDNLSNAKDDQPLCVSYILGSGECTGTIKKYSGDGGGAAFQMCKGESDVQLFRCPAQLPGSVPPPGPAAGMPMPSIADHFRILRDRCVETIDNVERVGGIVDLGDGGAELRLFTMPG